MNTSSNKLECQISFLDKQLVTPITIGWKNLTITAIMKDLDYKKNHFWEKSKTYNKIILDNLEGRFQEGSFTSILGPSGSGKTTLLNFLSNKFTAKNLRATGTVTINKNPVDDLGKFSRAFGYVEQDDILFPHFTPIQTFQFAAKLRSNMTEEQQNSAINELIEQFGLTDCQNTIIGDKYRSKISKSERKRLAIGIELLANPNLLFLDEPTTGLDSVTSLQILVILKSIANKGRTVITTIHQPSSNLFNEFKDLLLLVEGRIIYQGSSQKSKTYFDAIGYKCREHQNPADYYMNIMNAEGPMIDELKKIVKDKLNMDVDKEKILQEYQNRIQNLREQYDKSDLFAIQKSDYKCSDLNLKAISNIQPAKSFFYQTALLVKRNGKGMMAQAIIGIVYILMNSLWACALFNDLGKGRNAALNRTGFVYNLSMVLQFAGIFDVGLQIFNEKYLYIKETQNGTYKPFSYLFSKQGTLAIYEISYILLFQFLLWFGVGLSKSNYFHVTLIMYLYYEACASFGYFLASIVPRLEIMVALIPVLVIPFSVVSGGLVNTRNIKWYLKWLEYIAAQKYCYSALVQRVLKDTDDADLYDPNDCAQYEGSICQPLEEIDFTESITECLIALVILIVVYRTLAMIFLTLRSKPLKFKIANQKALLANTNTLGEEM